MLASAPILLMLFGWMDVAVADADTSWHAGDSAQAGSPGGAGDHCWYGWSHDHRGYGHCCTNDPPAGTTPAPKPSAKRTPAPAPLPTSRPATAAIPHAPVSPQAHTSAPSPSPSPSVETRPPVMAPPVLTVPPVGALTATAPNSGGLGVVAVSTVLVATTIAVASLVLIRRSD
jgi:hypothetical protein